MKKIFGSDGAVFDAVFSFFRPVTLVIRFGCDVFWMVFVKRSYGCDWYVSEKRHFDSSQTVLVNGNPKSKAARSGMSLFWQINFGWRWLAILEPAGGAGPKRIGFVDGNGKRHICTVETRRHRYFGMMVGGEPCTFFALDEDGEQVPLRLVKIASKYWLPKGTLVL